MYVSLFVCVCVCVCVDVPVRVCLCLCHCFLFPPLKASFNPPLIVLVTLQSLPMQTDPVEQHSGNGEGSQPGGRGFDFTVLTLSYIKGGNVD